MSFLRGGQSSCTVEKNSTVHGMKLQTLRFEKLANRQTF